MALPLPYGSGSALTRLMACPSSGVLPQVDTGTSAPAERGTALHRYLQNAGTMGRDNALALLPEDLQPFASGIDLATLPIGLSAEVTYAYDLDTGTARILGQDLGRDYSRLKPNEIPCTPDVVGAYELGGVYIGDWKFGRSDVPLPGVNAQMQLAALCAARVHGARLARIEIVRFFDDPARPVRYVDEMDAKQLDWFAEKLATFRKETDILRSHYLATGRAQYVKEGEHCKYCPAFTSCPAKVELLRQALAGNLPVVDGVADPDAYRRARDLEKLGAMAMVQIKALAKRQAYPIGNGKVYAETTSQERVFDPDITWDLVAELYGPRCADVAVERVVTAASITKAVSTQVEAKDVYRASKELISAIEKDGGVKYVPVTRLRETKL